MCRVEMGIKDTTSSEIGKSGWMELLGKLKGVQHCKHSKTCQSFRVPALGKTRQLGPLP